MEKYLLRTEKEVGEIYNRHVNSIYRICFTYMKNKADTEDAVQNTFVKLLKYSGEFQNEEHEKAWLIVTADKKLAVTSTPNQDNPLMDIAEVKGTPILGIDVWEHAYYLKYQNRRPDYLAAIWSVINWNHVSELYAKAIA